MEQQGAKTHTAHKFTWIVAVKVEEVPTLSSKRKPYLKALANNLSANVHVGSVMSLTRSSACIKHNLQRNKIWKITKFHLNLKLIPKTLKTKVKGQIWKVLIKLRLWRFNKCKRKRIKLTMSKTLQAKNWADMIKKCKIVISLTNL